MKISAVVVSWNNGPWLVKCVRSLVHSGIPVKRITVVETGKDRASLRSLSLLPSGVRVVKRPDNPGYGAAVNAGAGSALACDALLVLNADVEVIRSALETLKSELVGHPRTGCVTVRTHNETGRDTTHFRRTTLTRLSILLVFPRLWRTIRSFARTRPAMGRREVCFAEGSAFLVRMSAWQEIGGFDERFKYFGEDADLSIRLRKAGWKIVHHDSVSILHVGSLSFEKAGTDRTRLMLEGFLLWIWTHSPRRFPLVRLVLVTSLRLGSIGRGGSTDAKVYRTSVMAWDPFAGSTKPAERKQSESSKRISVIVPSYRRGALLRKFLKTLQPQLSTDTQVLVVFQEHTIMTHTKRIDVLRLKRPHRGRAKNVAWRAATGLVLLFCDDDIVPPHGFLTAHRAFHTNTDLRAVTCRMVEPRPAFDRTHGPVLTITEWGRVHTNFDRPERVQTGYAATGNMSVTRATLCATGGFDEAYRGTGVFEDADLGERLMKLGVTSWLEPFPVVDHEPQRNGNENERRRSPARYFYLFHHNLSYFYMKNRPWWQWPLAGVTALARSLRRTRMTDHPLRSAIFSFHGWWAGWRTYRHLVRP